jgi:RHS repeat-associated protein
LGNGIYDHPSQITTKDGQGNIKSKLTYTYDQGTPATSGAQQHISITGSRGNLTALSFLTSGTSTITRNFTYYDTGNLNTATDANGGVTTYKYLTDSCGYAFSTEIDLPIGGLIQKQDWNCTGAVLNWSQDLNGNQTTYSYGDPNFWRVTGIAYPDSGSTTFTYNEGTTFPWNIQTSSKQSGSNNVTSESILDGFGRTVTQELTSDPNGNGIDEVDTTYDVVGRVASVTNPHRSASNPTDGTTQYTYDPLNRITTVTHPDNTQIGLTYTGAAAQVKDEGYNTNGTNQITRIYQADGLGRTTSVCEVFSATLKGSSGTPAACNLDISGTGFLTTYAYDPFGNITQVTQPGVTTRTFSYDALSRLTQEVNAESGTTSYTYDHTGQEGDLYQRTRPQQNQTGSATTVTTYTFDKWHRLTGKSYNDSSTPSVTLTYDQATVGSISPAFPKGRLTNALVAGNAAGTIFSYDTMGRLAQEWQCTPLNCGSSNFNLQYSYDYLGEVSQFVNGKEGVTYTYTYDTATRLTKLTSSLSDSNHPGTLLTISSGNYNPLGEATQATLGNNIVRTLAYDNRGRITSQTDGSLYSFTLGYANDSNILTGNDSVNGSWTYTLDAMGRLSTSSKTGNAFNYQYDPAGNRWQQNVTTGSGPAPQYTFGTNNQIQGAGSGCLPSANYCYDSAGNLLNDSFYQYRYDAEGRLTTVGTASSNTNIATYTYDAFGKRVRTVANSQTSDFIFDPAGRTLDQVSGTTWQRGEIFAGGMHLGTYNNLVNPATTYFEHADWAGTVRARSSVTGASVETCTSLPFGDNQNCVGSDGSPLHFATLASDSESNLQHAWFRQYSTTSGRWTAQDPSGLAAVDLANPQSWNRYAYVRNNALALIDPLGLAQAAPPDPGAPIPDCWWFCFNDGGPGLGGGPASGPAPGGVGSGGTDPVNCKPLTPGCSNVPNPQELLLNQLKNCPQAAGMANSLMQMQESGKLVFTNLGGADGSTSLTGTISIDSTYGVTAHNLAHEYFHTMQMDTFVLAGQSGAGASGFPGAGPFVGAAAWVGARDYNAAASMLNGTPGFGPLDVQAEAFGQQISSQCGID